MHVEITSFGYGHGPAPSADLVDDLRGFRNVPADDGSRTALVHGTGLDADVYAYVLDTPGMAAHLALIHHHVRALALVTTTGDRYRVAFGCGGGRHRSVAAARYLAAALGDEHTVTVTHRDITRPILRGAAR